MRRGGATCVFVDGPYSNATRRSEWDEYPEWHGFLSDDDGELCGTVGYFTDFDAAFEWGEAEAARTGLEFVFEATRA